MTTHVPCETCSRPVRTIEHGGTPFRGRGVQNACSLQCAIKRALELEGKVL